MAILGDYHTHTEHSRRGRHLHAEGSVLENARAARAAGLKELAVTDHGYSHYFGVESRDDFAALVEECRAAELETGVNIYIGLENDIDWRSGKNKKHPALMECDGEVLAELEIVQGGYHAMAGTPTILRNMLFWVRNVIFKFLPGRKKLIKRNTVAYKRVIDEYPVDFIGHLNRGILADAVEIAKYAHERGVYIELNGRHKSLGRKEIQAMVAAGVEFICNSDAHKPQAVGTMPIAEKLIKECGIPYELIANWDRLPEFRSQNFRSARAKKNEEASNVND